MSFNPIPGLNRSSWRRVFICRFNIKQNCFGIPSTFEPFTFNANIVQSVYDFVSMKNILEKHTLYEGRRMHGQHANISELLDDIFFVYLLVLF